MSEEPKKKVGKKIEAAEAATLDPAHRIDPLPEPEVEGQHLYVDYISCPWCDNTIRMQLETRHYVYWNCGSCGNLFRA